MINRVNLTGRLTKDADLRYTPNGVPVATFTIAVDRLHKGSNGEKQTDFINCVTWRKQAENLANFTKKGCMIAVDGRIQTRNYEGQDGRRVFVTEVLAEFIQYLEFKRSSKQKQEDAPPPTYESNENKSASEVYGDYRKSYNDDPFANDGNHIDISDDDLPF